MNYLETLLTQALTEVKKIREPLGFSKGFHEGYAAAERFYTQSNPYLPKGCKGSEMPKKTDFGELLIAYFERRDRENAKRAEKLEKKVATEFSPLGLLTQNVRSSYFFSGKSEAYANAAQKVREMLGEPKEVPLERQGTLSNYLTNPVIEDCFGNKPEKWIVEAKAYSGWRRSTDVPEAFISKVSAEKAVEDARVRYGSLPDLRRARRVE